mmetsp:Transcript_44789/g.106314  ORF Transcript_44789/g.106314 Transcript_44789/m.106314 type:complete len:299 (-) Transcript_44789:185-1081(-)
MIGQEPEERLESHELQPAMATPAAAEDAPAEKDLITFNVAGERFQVLEHIIRAKGETLLTTLLDDPGRVEGKAIFVSGNPKLFPLILDWFRFGGAILIPSSVSLQQMQRECAFYQLPEEVPIKRERVSEVVAELNKDTAQSLKRARQNVKQHKEAFKAAGIELAAAMVYRDMLGTIRKEHKWRTSKPVSGLPNLQLCAKQKKRTFRACPACGHQADLGSWRVHKFWCPACGSYAKNKGEFAADYFQEWFSPEPEGDIALVLSRVSDLAAADGWDYTYTSEKAPTGTLRLPRPQQCQQP